MKIISSFLLPLAVLGDSEGVPSDLIPLLPTYVSPDFGKFPSCELPRGSNMNGAGICVPVDNLTSLEFCGEYVDYPACVPPTNPVWQAWTVAAKDRLVKQLFDAAVADREEREQESLTAGEYVPMLFTGNPECVSEYKKIICLFNFPSCDGSAKLNAVSVTSGICSNRCTDYFSKCKLDDSLIATYCEAVDSYWPLSAEENAKATSDSSLLVGGSDAECTGKRFDILSPTYAIAVAVISILSSF